MKKREKYLSRLLCLSACVFGLCIGVSAECDHVYEIYEMPAGCVTPGLHEEWCIYCGVPGEVYNLEPLGHDLTDWEDILQPGCTTVGKKRRKCRRCSFCEECAVDAIGHQYKSEVIKPTCTKKGYTLYRCTRCDDTYRENETEAIGHHYDQGILTKEPTTTAMGRITYTCLNCGDTYQETTPKLTNPFEDVKPKNYFYNSVLWAANMGITSGVDMTHFAPSQTCTRGQVMVFLWRSMGSPEPASDENPFIDVQSRDYFAKAVLWAYHAGVTAGVDGAHFGPNNPCTRAQVVTFLHSTRGKPIHSGENVFYDVDNTTYYYNAVLWAADNNITTGVGDGMFAPSQKCDRGQIVTFLYQARNV